MSLSDAVPREVAWLNSSGDGLPTLVAPDGPWDLIQVWRPRTAQMRKSAVYVLRNIYTVKRFANIRSMTTHDFKLKLFWPLSSGTGEAESDFAEFEYAVQQLVLRILGQLGDKTHGGRFLSIAEDPNFLIVELQDPDTTIGSQAGFLGEITYSGDDPEFPN